MNKKNEIIPQEIILRELELWKSGKADSCNEYETMWQMFHKVIETSSWGTSEFGGPVWIMDFTLENLHKLFPQNLLLDFMENEKSKGLNASLSAFMSLSSFSEWFSKRAHNFIIRQGLGNVILKKECGWTSCLRFYCWADVLRAIRGMIGGEITTPSDQDMIEYEFSYREKQHIDDNEFLTFLDCQTMVDRYPTFIGLSTLVRSSDIYGDCYPLPNHNSLPLGSFVIPETISEKILILLINDLMDAKARNYSGKNDEAIVLRNTKIKRYPLMKYRQCLDYEMPCGHHFVPSDNKFTWSYKDNGILKFKEIKIDLPEIAPEYGEFWHKQFPPKQTWRQL